MKRTHKVNVGGFSFNIEDDAIKPLEAYLDSVRDAYHGVEDEKEITDDIEERIGELLVERTTAERVVSVNEVNAVKAIMGEFGHVRETPPEDAGAAVKPRRRLYRDIDNKVFGGVASGLAAHFDRDVVIFRLAFSLLAVASFILARLFSPIGGSVILAYIIMWICIPAARTVEQRCEMNGRPVSAREFDASRSSRPAESPRRTGSGLGQILLVILGAIMIINGLGSLVLGVCYDFIPKLVTTFAEDPDVTRAVGAVFSTPFMISLILSSALWGIWNIYVGVVMAFDLRSPRWRPGLMLFIASVASAIACIFFLVRSCLEIPMIFNI